MYVFEVWLLYTAGSVSAFGKVCQARARMFSRLQLFVNPWTVACQTALSMEFSK